MAHEDELVAEAGEHVVEPIPNFGRSVVLTTITNVVLSGFGVITGILVARLLRPEGRGVLAAVQLWPSLVATLAVVGLPEALVYFSARQRERAGSHLTSAVALALLISIPFALIAYVLMPVLLAQQPADVVALARRLLVVIPINATLGMLLHPLRGRGDFRAWNALRIVPTIAWLGLLLSADVLGIRDPASLAVAQVAMFALLIIPMGLVVVLRIRGSFKIETRTWKPMLVYGMPSMIATVPHLLNLRLDQMVMAAFLVPQSLGFYVVAIAWAAATQPLLAAIGSVLLPNVAAQTGQDGQRSALVGGVRLAVLTALVVAPVMIAVTPIALPLALGAEFRPAVSPAMLLIVASSVLGVNLVMEEGARGLGKPKIVVWAELCGAGATFAALYVLVRPFGIAGAAVASLIGHLGSSLVLLTALSRALQEPVTSFLRPSVGDFLRRTRALMRRRTAPTPDGE